MGWRRTSDGRAAASVRSRFAAFAALTAALLLGSSVAQAGPFIPFDAATASDGFSYGFVNPGDYGITSFREMDNFYTASRSDNAAAAPTSLLHVDPVSYERCPRASDNCSNDFHVFDVEWTVTMNADILPDPNAAYDVDLILVDSDPASRFSDLMVTVDAASAEIDGTRVGFETADYRNGDYYFLDAVLGSMSNDETRTLKFTYRIEGELPLAGGGDVGFLFPTILPAAFLPVPEPGTATMFGLGLTVLAWRRRRP